MLHIVALSLYHAFLRFPDEQPLHRPRHHSHRIHDPMIRNDSMLDTLRRILLDELYAVLDSSRL